jgi:hypothetical protein
MAFFGQVLKTGADLKEISHVRVSKKLWGTTLLRWRERRRGNDLTYEYADNEPPLRAALLSAD